MPPQGPPPGPQGSDRQEGQEACSPSPTAILTREVLPSRVWAPQPPSLFPTLTPPGSRLCSTARGAMGAQARPPRVPSVRACIPGSRAVLPALQRREDAGVRAGGPGHRYLLLGAGPTKHKHPGTSLLLPAEGVPSAVLCSLQGTAATMAHQEAPPAHSWSPNSTPAEVSPGRPAYYFLRQHVCPESKH